MPNLLRPALCFSLLAVAACDEIAVADNPEARAELRGQKTCVRAVINQTGVAEATINTTVPIIETNYFIVDLPDGKQWSCVTDETNRATQIAPLNA